MDSRPTDDDRKQTTDARHTASSAIASVHTWRWERMGALAEVQEVVGALEKLNRVLKTRESQEWDPLARRWVEKGPKTGPAVQWNRTTGA